MSRPIDSRTRQGVINGHRDVPSGMPDTTQFLVLLMSATEAKTSASKPDASNLETSTLVTCKGQPEGGVGGYHKTVSCFNMFNPDLETSHNNCSIIFQRVIFRSQNPQRFGGWA